MPWRRKSPWTVNNHVHLNPNVFLTSLGEEFDGSLLAISWAKPVDKKQRQLAKNFGKTFYDGVTTYPSVNDVSGGDQEESETYIFICKDIS